MTVNTSKLEPILQKVFEQHRAKDNKVRSYEHRHRQNKLSANSMIKLIEDYTNYTVHLIPRKTRKTRKKQNA